MALEQGRLGRRERDQILRRWWWLGLRWLTDRGVITNLANLAVAVVEEIHQLVELETGIQGEVEIAHFF